MKREMRKKRQGLQDKITLLRASAAATRTRDPRGAQIKQDKANALEQRMENIK